MKLKFKNHQLLLLIPALFAFLITLIPTLSYQWPLSWDIIYHIELAKVYSQYGFVLTNPLLIPGQKIGYPPLFHFLIAFLGNALNIDYFQIARFLQPFLAMSIVLSVSYVAKKLYGNIAGISAGFLIISSYISFRIMMPLPENLALIFVTFSVYFYYTSLSKKIPKYALIAGILLLLTIATHLGATLCLILAISSFTLLELIIYMNKSVLKSYGAFFLPLIILTAHSAFVLMLWKPDLLHSILQQGIFNFIGYPTSFLYTIPMNMLHYFGFLGIFVSIFAFIGGIIVIKNRHKKDMFILTWIIALFLLSKSYWFGINVESSRILIYMLIPISILGGYGLKQVYHKLKEYPRFSSLNFRSAFLISIFTLSIFFGLLNTEKPFTFYVNPLGKVQIAPPSPSEADLANWFKVNGDKEKNLIISNYYSGIFLLAMTTMPLYMGFGNFNKNTPKSVFDTNNIGYIVYDKRLIVQSKNGTFYRENIWSQFFYYSGDIHKNIDKIIPSSAKVVYENKEFIVCKIE